MELNKFTDILKEKYGDEAKDIKPQQAHEILSSLIMKKIAPNWKESQNVHSDNRRAFYLSIEFLMGRAIFNNLLALSLIGEADKALSKVGLRLSDLEEIEDMALGNGGLGRLAACFLDSAATHNLPLDGYGIRYKYGLFKQTIEDGFQKEKPDDWTKYGDPWSVRTESDIVEIYFADQKVKAVPYDMPIVGYGTKNIGTLRLWQAEADIDSEFDFSLFDSGDYTGASIKKIIAEDISRCLYPNDSSYEGKLLRLRQEYFFSAASVKDAINKHLKKGRNIREFYNWNTFQLNDTHPVIAIAELVRLLIDEHELDFSDALEIAKKTFNYTNHTIMAEALEKWDVAYFKKILPRIYEICIQINEAFIGEMYLNRMPKEKIYDLKMISGQPETIHMAKMAIYCSGTVNGVAVIHTEILKNSALKEWYELYPKKFQNKTNGITPRRWLRLCNPELSKQITDLLGGEDWVRDLSLLQNLKKYQDDNAQIERFMEIKKQKKIQLAKYIQKVEGVVINPDSIFDIHVKRLHEYKRQLLNALGILYIYYGIKEGMIENFYPTTFIFGAKSAPGYARAKGIIKYINEIGRLVNADPQTRDLLKVVFIQNYSVSYAEKLITAADISEQISTAGTEASGTGNMKFMLNGAVTLGTYDGANIEIVQEAGENNNYIFGATVEELEKYIMKIYDPRYWAENFPRIGKVMRSLIDGTANDGGSGIFRELYFSILDGAEWHSPDNYHLLGDLNSYIEARLRANSDYRSDRASFAKKCWLNMAGAGKFSSDRTILEYADSIWKIEKLYN